MNGAISFNNQVLNEQNAQLMFADEAKDALHDQADDALNAALSSGIGQILQGAADVGSGLAMHSTTTMVEEAPGKVNPKTGNGVLTDADIGLEENLSPKKTPQTNYQQSKLSESLKGVGLMAGGTGTVLGGLAQKQEKIDAAREKMDEYGQSAAKTMVDQEMGQVSTLESEITQTLAGFTQNGRAGTGA
jgi:hypothetical protein